MTFTFSDNTDELSAELIDPQLMNLELLKKIITSQSITCEITKNYIYVEKGLAASIFISIEEKTQLIKLRTYLEVKPNITDQEIKEIIKKLNAETGPLKFTSRVTKETSSFNTYLEADYYFFYEFGVSKEYILYLIRFFSLSFCNAIKLVNINKKIADIFSA